MRTICFTAFMVLILITSCKKQDASNTAPEPVVQDVKPIAADTQSPLKRDTLDALGNSFFQMLKKRDQDGMQRCWLSPQDIELLKKKGHPLSKEFNEDSSEDFSLVKAQLPVMLKHFDDNGYQLSALQFVSLTYEAKEERILDGQNVVTCAYITLKLKADKDTTIDIMFENGVMVEGAWYFYEEILKVSVTQGGKKTKVTIPSQL